jgi:hypothetical protein
LPNEPRNVSFRRNSPFPSSAHAGHPCALIGYSKGSEQIAKAVVRSSLQSTLLRQHFSDGEWRNRGLGEVALTDNSDSKIALTYDRILHPGPETVLYHYCSTATLLAILEYGKLRFSDINMMNDPREWRYCYELFEQAATALLKMVPDRAPLDGLDTSFFDRVDDYLSPKQLNSHPVIACFSKRPDVLSQWRGYADDAKGWSIGFSGRAVNAMPVTLLDVVYDPEQQIAEMRNFLAAMYLTWREKGGEFKEAVGQEAALFASLIHGYKHPSFEEEQEVRALHELRVDLSEDGWELIDEGGTANGVEVAGEPVAFRAAGSAIVAYVDLPLQRVEGVAISELWFGPSNDNGPGNALYSLTRYGHRNVGLNWSASSFRA